jgi:mannose-6-phosphate isomerase
MTVGRATVPVRLAPNTIEHFYRGGSRIAALRGIEVASDHRPEEWLAATVSRFGEDTVGPARTEDGTLLGDLVARDPDGWLGEVAATQPRAGDADTGVLVKLLDAAQRLPVHVHPDREFARTHLDCPYGKTEAWYVLDADDDAAVYLGWAGDVLADELAERRDAQDSAWMLARMNRIPVKPGDGILVPAGLVHAIGEGVFVVEAQEPTDFSVVLEWSVTTSSREDSHLGVGFDTAMQAVTHTALGISGIEGLRCHVARAAEDTAAMRCLPEEADRFFRLHVVAPPRDDACAVEAGYAVALVLEGHGRLASEQGELEVAKGDVLAVPAGFGDWQARGRLRLVVARPGAGWPVGLVRKDLS